ncbi:hypothetical protein HNR19_000046 [Nocardioides thalensis]|uniref:Calcium-binding protein n=1 Tax=Nocardioides thalensis TaxID=1914755 RepID=A0A853BY29_9ACTN|nr:calcium-binding protein [Nocardioides thalensis]NYI99347.1 hypothetical protein [Nocardioides thalensis]
MTATPLTALRPARLAAAIVAALALLAPAGLHVAADARPAPKCGGKTVTIVGTDRSETIRGTDGDDVILARGGKDKVLGHGGTDHVCGGAGNDRIIAGNDDGGYYDGEGGADVVVGRGDHAVLEGGPGPDVLSTTRDGSLLVGGGGDDTIIGGDHSDNIRAGAGDDHVEAGGDNDLDVDGGPGDDEVDGGPGSDLIRGGDGNDTLRPGGGAGGFAHGEAGDDTLVAGDAGQGLSGGSGDDHLETRFEGTLLEGNAGNDWILGSDFEDHIDGGSGDDNLFGEGGDDLDLEGGDGADGCVGGAGRDRCDGGSPGTTANTPEDPDTCEAEVKVSCRGSLLPQRYQLHLEGTRTRVHDDSAMSAHWEATMILVRVGNPDTSALWQYESGHGTFEVSGHYASCTYTHEGTLDSGFSADLGMVVPAREQYWLDVVVGGEGLRSATCAGGSHQEIETFQEWAATNGGPDPIPLDPTQRTIIGSWEVDGPNEDLDVDWVITPLGDDPQ